MAGCARYVEIDPSAAPSAFSAAFSPTEFLGPNEHTVFRIYPTSATGDGNELVDYRSCDAQVKTLPPAGADARTTDGIRHCLEAKGYTVTLAQRVVNEGGERPKPTLAFEPIPPSKGEYIRQDYLGCRRSAVGPDPRTSFNTDDYTAPSNPEAIDKIKTCMSALGYTAK